MRTTLVIDDAIYRQVKIRAAETGKTVSELVSELLKTGLEPPPSTAPRYDFPTFGDSSKPYGITFDAFKRSVAEDETTHDWKKLGLDALP